jgi:hypothetical protein
MASDTKNKKASSDGGDGDRFEKVNERLERDP